MLRRTLLCLATVLPIAACAVESAPPEDTRAQDITAAPVDQSALVGTCSPLSLGFCAGQSIGTTCHTGPRLFCLPSNEAPDGGVLCGCQGNSSI